mmetsp:Transcript_11780/g.23711  ORF Transcript_11780/g.23711 Transcript_11780/m.23711 type:complete len:250 (+) Transcript_11780:160-909(+)
MDSGESNETKSVPNFLDQILQTEQEAREENSGLAIYKDLRVESVRQFREIPTATYKAFKSELKLHESLPKPATLAEHSFLLPPKTRGKVKELYEDNYNAGILNYAAAADVYLQVLRLIGEEKLEKEDPLVSAVRKLLITASNTPARATSTYRRIASKSALSTAGSDRESLLSNEEAKTINTTVDVAAKLRKATFPTAPRTDYRRRHQGGGFPNPLLYRRPCQPSYYPRGRRGGRGGNQHFRGGRRGGRR